MVFTTFKYKTQIENGLDEPMFNFVKPGIKLKGGIPTIAIHRVTEFDIMRLDLISEKYYQTVDYVDIILKMNGLYNPFSINEGQYIRIPDKDSAVRFSEKLKKISVKPRTQFTDPRKMTQEDKRRVDFIKNKSKSKTNGSSENLPPNILKVNEGVKEFKDGRILLGSNIKSTNRNR